MAGQVLEGGFWKIGLYIRLSREDGSADGSESIKNQEKILFDFVREYSSRRPALYRGFFRTTASAGRIPTVPAFWLFAKRS